MVNPKYMASAVRAVESRMALGRSEEHVIAEIIAGFRIPWREFIPEYFKITGRCPNRYREYLVDQPADR